MRFHNVSALALCAAIAATSAFAADLPSRKAPPHLPPPPPMWTGFYAGLNAGGTWGDNSAVQSAGVPFLLEDSGVIPGFWANLAAGSANHNFGVGNNGGFIGGGQFGYNYQFSTSFVAGIETDIQGVAGSNGGGARAIAVAVPPNQNNPLITIGQAHKSLDYLGTVRGRLGWLVTPTLLVYGTGGLAYGGIETSVSIAQAIGGRTGERAGVGLGAASVSDTRVGWTAGGGLEWMFWPNVSAKVEYLYYDLGSVSYVVGTPTVDPLRCGFCTGNGPSAPLVDATTRFSGHIVRAGVNYHFNWGAPAQAVANY